MIGKHAYTSTHKYSYTHVDRYTYISVKTHTHTHMQMHIHREVSTLISWNIRTHTYRNTYMHKCIKIIPMCKSTCQYLHRCKRPRMDMQVELHGCPDTYANISAHTLTNTHTCTHAWACHMKMQASTQIYKYRHRCISTGKFIGMRGPQTPEKTQVCAGWHLWTHTCMQMQAQIHGPMCVCAYVSIYTQKDMYSTHTHTHIHGRIHVRLQ